MAVGSVVARVCYLWEFSTSAQVKYALVRRRGVSGGEPALHEVPHDVIIKS